LLFVAVVVVVDSIVSDLFPSCYSFSRLWRRVLTTFHLRLAALEAGLACAPLEDDNKIVSCLEKGAVAPSHQQLRRQELEDGRKVLGWEKDDTTPSSNAGVSLKTLATLPVCELETSSRRESARR
jgi:hypothetical protein